MIGLVKKDFITFKKQKFSTIASIFIPLTLFLILWQSTGALLLGVLVLPFLTAFTPFTFRASDEQWKWDKYAISLPVSKKQIVASRYMSCCLISAVYFLLSLILNIGAYVWFQDHSISIHLASAFIGLGVSLFFVLLLLPTSYAKGLGVSMWILAVVVIIYCIAIAIMRKTNFDFFSLSPTPQQITLLIAIGVAVLIGFSILSYTASVAMYRKKYS